MSNMETNTATKTAINAARSYLFQNLIVLSPHVTKLPPLDEKHISYTLCTPEKARLTRLSQRQSYTLKSKK